VLLAGLGAVIVSLTECVLGLLLSTGAVPGGHSEQAAILLHTINRLDGVKMLALATTGFAAVGLARRGGLMPRWWGWVSAGWEQR
jgi:hypothetical protein